MNDTQIIRDELAAAKEKRRLELQQTFNLNELKMIRKELFPSLRDPAVTFREESVTFNNACINGLEDVIYIQMFVEERRKHFVVRGCDENDINALRWCVARPDKRKSRRMRCPRLMEKLYRLMNWDKECRYRALGYKIESGGELFYVFDLKVTQIFREKGAEAINGNDEVQPAAERREYFSDDVAMTMEQYRAANAGMRDTVNIVLNSAEKTNEVSEDLHAVKNNGKSKDSDSDSRQWSFDW
ncbi:MAG: hypothetical protein IJU07_03120 [Synergistaceae bacterium]|nr:hypothetical protein [Synergistaceae bacterium]